MNPSALVIPRLLPLQKAQIKRCKPLESIRKEQLLATYIVYLAYTLT